MGDKTKIDWADATWNPVTGCLHGCEYCYARRIAERFGGCSVFDPVGDSVVVHNTSGKELICELNNPVSKVDGIDPILGRKVSKAPYPFGFAPTLHRYRLDIPARWTKPRNIFVCSMADLFGEWVPDEWIQEVLQACLKAPQHRYLFLSKNPGRYSDLHRKGILPETPRFWYGASFDHSNWDHKRIPGRKTTFSINGKPVHDAGDYYYPIYPEKNRFVSFEPLLYDIGANIGNTSAEWLIIGAETGKRKGRVQCQREWVEHIVQYSDKTGIPVFMKESLRELMGPDFRQEFPWEG